MELAFFVILYFIVTTFAGLNIILIFDKDNALGCVEVLALAYLFGVAAITAEMFLMGSFGIKFTSLLIIMPWIALSIAIAPRYLKFARKALKSAKMSIPRFDLAEKIILCLLILAVSYTFFIAFLKPMEDYDSVAIWAYKAKAIYLAQPKDFLDVIKTRFIDVHPDYPYLFPMSEVWLYTFLNRFDDYTVKIIFPVSYLAFLLIFYFSLKKAALKRRLSLAMTFMLASVSHFSLFATNGYADSQMSIYCSIAFILLYLWAKEKKRVYFLGAIFSAAAAFWTKNEGSVVVIAMLTVLAVRLNKRTLRSVVPYAIALCLCIAGWAIFKNRMSLQNDVMNMETFRHFNVFMSFKRLGAILYEYQKNIFGLKYWNLAWLIFIYAVVRNFKNTLTSPYIFITLPVFVILIGYTIIYMITPHDIVWHLTTSAERLLLHVLPLGLFYSGLVIGNDRG